MTIRMSLTEREIYNKEIERARKNSRDTKKKIKKHKAKKGQK